MKRIWMSLLICFALVSSARAEIKTEAFDYSSGNKLFKGFLAYDDAVGGKRPGILVVHEWWGLNDYARARAKMLAELGYTALAVDMYGEGKVAGHPDDAKAFSSEVTQNMTGAGKARFLVAMHVLKNHPTVDPRKIGAIGYCFGGGTVLHMARLGVDLAGVVSFHGSLSTPNPARPENVKAKILVCHGGADSFISPEDIEAFKQEMEKAGADYQFITYDGAVHSFTNPDADRLSKEFNIAGIAYDETADKKSWEDMKAFFQEIFNPR